MMDCSQREQCYREGRELFHAQRYFDCHEVWEDLWRQSRGAQKQLLQGLIQAAVGCHHWQHGNPVGARRVWTRSLLNLRAAAPLLGLESALANLRFCLETCLRLADTEALLLPRLDLEELPPNRECGTAGD
jgi:hypothetical protein